MSSLIDALLLEPPQIDLSRAGQEIWLAIRSDGQGGSGAQSDAFDCSVRSGPAMSATIEAVTGAFNIPVAEVTLAGGVAHGLVNYDVVVITGAGAPWDGTFQVFDVTATTFRYQPSSAFQPSAPLPTGQHQASVSRIIYRFDEIMRSLPDYCAVHLGPGVFETRGLCPNRREAGTTATVAFNNSTGPGWRIRIGQKFIGAGMGLTTVRLMHATRLYNSTNPDGTLNPAGTQLCSAFAYKPSLSPPPLSHDVVIRDLTVDCNMRSQQNQVVTKGATELAGNFTRVNRVRAIDFGTNGIAECFVIGAAGGHKSYGLAAVDSRIEDCVIESPSRQGIYTSTCLQLTAGEVPTSGEMAFHRACAIRHCYMDASFTDDPVSVDSITRISGTEADLQTRAPHGRQVGDWIIISGAMENGAASSHYNGSFQVTHKDSDYSIRFVPYNNPAASPTGDIMIGQFSSLKVAVKWIEKTGDGLSALLTSHRPHNRKPGDQILVAATTAPLAGSESFFGWFPVEAVISPFVLKYRMHSEPAKFCVSQQACAPPPGEECAALTVFLGPGMNGLGADGGSQTVVEGNRVFNATTGGPYHDTWGTKDLTARGNYYSDVVVGPFQFLARTSTLRTAASFSVVGTTATFQTVFNHGLVVGQAVFIADPNGQPTPPFAGYFAITEVPSEKSFQWEYEEAPSGAPASGYKFAAIWQVGRNLIENNIIELAQNRHPDTGYGPSIAIPVWGNAQFLPQYVHRWLGVRENILRLLPGTANPQAYAVNPVGVEKLLVQRNTIEMENAMPVLGASIGSAGFFGNEAPDGQPVFGFANSLPPMPYDELRTRIEDALLLTL